MVIKRTTLIGSILVLIILMAACATARQNPSPTQNDDLMDIKWVLISLNGTALIEDKEITLKFKEETLEGSGDATRTKGVIPHPATA